jgi:hypothetical protein
LQFSRISEVANKNTSKLKNFKEPQFSWQLFAEIVTRRDFNYKEELEKLLY